MKSRLIIASATALAALAAAGCGGAADTKDAAADTGDGGKKLALVAYSTPQAVYDDMIPAFRKTPHGSGASFSESFGASGDQSRAVEAGQPADVVGFSLATDMTRLVDAGLVAPDWSKTPTRGMVSDSVVSFVVRKGNPKHIRSWDDLLEPGVEVLTPNPFTSGSARWNLMAAYGAQINEGKSPAQALGYVRELITKHVAVQDKSGRDALNTFTTGKGDVLLSYENEAITAQQNDKRVDYVVPGDTILIENPIAVTEKAPAQARAFLDYALSPKGQQVFADHGYRPVDKRVFKRNAKTFPIPTGLFTIADLGGWDKVADEFFDVEHGAVAKIEEDAGVSTAK